MKLKIRDITAFLYLLFCFCLLTPQTAVQAQSTNTDALLNKNVSVRMDGVYTFRVLDFLAGEYNFPVGVEIAPSPEDKKISVNIFQQPLRAALDAIVEADPDYKWEVNDGVVNLIPKNETDSLLTIRIKSFQARNLNRLDTRRAIGALPEVKAKLDRLGLEFSDLSVWRTREIQDQMRLTINMRDTTLKAILNELAKKTGEWGISIFGKFVFIRV
jgi:hypothetical protein